MNSQKMIIAVFVTMILLIPPLDLFAGEEVEVNGLIINQGQTRLGHEFYRYFSNLWGDPPLTFQYNIEVREMADVRWGSMISVLVNGHVAFRERIQPRSGIADAAVKKALPQVKRLLGYLIETDGSGDTQDLKGDGF